MQAKPLATNLGEQANKIAVSVQSGDGDVLALWGMCRRYAMQQAMQKYNEARRERTEAARNVLQERAHAAADTLATIMQDADAPAQTRVSAAAEILRQNVKYTEITDIMQQLDELEAWRREQENR